MICRSGSANCEVVQIEAKPMFLENNIVFKNTMIWVSIHVVMRGRDDEGFELKNDQLMPFSSSIWSLSLSLRSHRKSV